MARRPSAMMDSQASPSSSYDRSSLKMDLALIGLTLVVGVVLLACASGAAFSAGNLVVYRRRDESTTYPIAIDEYSTSGELIDGTVNIEDNDDMPCCVGKAYSALDSYNGRYLTFACMNLPAGIGYSSSNGARLVRMHHDGSFDKSTTTGPNLMAYSAATTADGASFWFGGSLSDTRSGDPLPCTVNYEEYQAENVSVTLGTQVADTTIMGAWSTHIFDGQLYVAAGLSSIIQVGTDLPDDETTLNVWGPALPDGLGAYDFVAFDFNDAISGPDVLYIWAGMPHGENCQLLKYYKSEATTWNDAGSLVLERYSSGTGTINPDLSVTLFFTMGYGLYRIDDDSGSSGTMEVTLGEPLAVSDTDSDGLLSVAWAPTASADTYPFRYRRTTPTPTPTPIIPTGDDDDGDSSALRLAVPILF